MIIGTGMIARAFATYRADKGVIIFASGVSNSLEQNPVCFERERILLQETILTYPQAILVYFGTCSVDDKELAASAYVQHKIEMERLIQQSSQRYFIFRLSQVVGKSNSPTLINFFVEKIKSGEPFSVWKNSTRNIIDVDDVFKIANYLIQNGVYLNEITNIAAPNCLPIFDIVTIIENLENKKGCFCIEEKGGSYTINTDKISLYREGSGVSFFDEYPKSIIEKYFFGSDF
jgi:nucleoside-diphosphate-sugar epimerase